jgi:prepilin-type N-terminal cleavage/methylation domain-containing protein
MGLVHRQRGFTLTEVLVTTVVIGVLAATMLPALMRQTSAADPARLASEIGTIKTGIEIFSNNMRPFFPGDLEDLVNLPATPGDSTIATSGYTNTNRWKGPYVQQTHAAAATIAAGVATPWRAGANGFYMADLKICNVAVTTSLCPAASGTSSDFVALEMTGLSDTEILELNAMIDGAGEAAPQLTSGLLRGDTTVAATGYFYAVPFTP